MQKGSWGRVSQAVKQHFESVSCKMGCRQFYLLLTLLKSIQSKTVKNN